MCYYLNVHFQGQKVNICKEIGGKLDNKHSYYEVPYSVETSHEVKVTTLWKQQVRNEGSIPGDIKSNMYVNSC